MTPAGKSLFYFGIYVLLTGLQFIIIPEKLIAILQLPPIANGWASAIGLLAMVIGSYDIYCGYANVQPVLKISIFVRLGFAIGTVLLFVSGQMPITVILLGAIDALGALWTYFALRTEALKV
jgi:hypothetical protein